MSNLLFRPQAGGGSGSGFGGINYIDNPNATQTTTGWVTYADAAGSQPVNGTGGTPSITLTRDTNSLTIGTTSFLITKDAANRQGEGISFDFSIDTALKNCPISISTYLATSANFVFGSIDGVTPSDVTVYVYDVTNSLLIPVFPNVLTSNIGKFTGQFQATSSASYRLIFHIGTTNALAWTLALGEVVVSPLESQFIQADSDWESYTPTFTGFGTVSTSNIQFRKDGPDLLLDGTFITGTPTATEGRISFPDGLISASNLPTLSSAGKYFRGANDSLHGGAILKEASKGYITFGPATTFSNTASVALSKANGSDATTNTETITIEARIPIQGWTSGVSTIGQWAQKVPVFLKAYKNGGAVTNGVDIGSWTTIKDSVGMFNASTGQATIKIPGDYSASFSYVITATNTDSPGIYVNGSLVPGSRLSSDGSAQRKTVTIDIPNLVVGDVVSVRPFVNATCTSSTTDTTFSLKLINDPSAFLTINRSTTKYLASNLTSSTTDIASLKCNGTLTVGKKYRVDINMDASQGAASSNSELKAMHNGSVVARSFWTNASGTEDMHSSVGYFTATTTTLTFDWAKVGTMTLNGDGTASKTNITITELNNTFEGNF